MLCCWRSRSALRDNHLLALAQALSIEKGEVMEWYIEDGNLVLRRL